MSDYTHNDMLHKKSINMHVLSSSLSLTANKANPALDANGKASKHHAMIYTDQAIRAHPEIQLTHGGLILFALLTGGDYDKVSVMSACIALAFSHVNRASISLARQPRMHSLAVDLATSFWKRSEPARSKVFICFYRDGETQSTTNLRPTREVSSRKLIPGSHFQTTSRLWKC